MFWASPLRTARIQRASGVRDGKSGPGQEAVAQHTGRDRRDRRLRRGFEEGQPDRKCHEIHTGVPRAIRHPGQIRSVVAGDSSTGTMATLSMTPSHCWRSALWQPVDHPPPGRCPRAKLSPHLVDRRGENDLALGRTAGSSTTWPSERRAHFRVSAAPGELGAAGLVAQPRRLTARRDQAPAGTESRRAICVMNHGGPVRE